jgi:nicotinamide phosphoribosyltransferase
VVHLLQQVNRDTLKFAMKCSAISKWATVNGAMSTRSRSAKMLPSSESRTWSLRGRKDGWWRIHQRVMLPLRWNVEDQLKVRYENGVLFNQTSFEEVRARANETK